MTRGEHGAATVLGMAMTFLLVVVTIGVACGVSVVRAHRTAQAAADLAALAGARALQDGSDACARASAIARRNQARLRSCDLDGWTVLVVVDATSRLPVGSVSLPARAKAGPVSLT